MRYRESGVGSRRLCVQNEINGVEYERVHPSWELGKVIAQTFSPLAQEQQKQNKTKNNNNSKVKERVAIDLYLTLHCTVRGRSINAPQKVI